MKLNVSSLSEGATFMLYMNVWNRKSLPQKLFDLIKFDFKKVDQKIIENNLKFGFLDVYNENISNSLHKDELIKYDLGLFGVNFKNDFKKSYTDFASGLYIDEKIVKAILFLDNFFGLTLENINIYLVDTNITDDKFNGYGITNSRLKDSIFIFCPSRPSCDLEEFKQIILHEIVHLYIYNADILQEVEALINSSDKVYVNKIKSDLNEVVARVFITPKIQGLLYEEESNMNGSKIEYRDRFNAIAHEIILYIKKNGLTKIDSDLIKFAVQRISSIC